MALLNDNKTISLTNAALAEGLFRLSFKAMGTACEISFSAESSSQAEAFRKKAFLGLEILKNATLDICLKV